MKIGPETRFQAGEKMKIQRETEMTLKNAEENGEKSKKMNLKECNVFVFTLFHFFYCKHVTCDGNSSSG